MITTPHIDAMTRCRLEILSDILGVIILMKYSSTSCKPAAVIPGSWDISFSVFICHVRCLAAENLRTADHNLRSAIISIIQLMLAA